MVNVEPKSLMNNWCCEAAKKTWRLCQSPIASFWPLLQRKALEGRRANRRVKTVPSIEPEAQERSGHLRTRFTGAEDVWSSPWATFAIGAATAKIYGYSFASFVALQQAGGHFPL